jgi:hypothetical protein
MDSVPDMCCELISVADFWSGADLSLTIPLSAFNRVRNFIAGIAEYLSRLGTPG